MHACKHNFTTLTVLFSSHPPPPPPPPMTSLPPPLKLSPVSEDVSSKNKFKKNYRYSLQSLWDWEGSEVGRNKEVLREVLNCEREPQSLMWAERLFQTRGAWTVTKSHKFTTCTRKKCFHLNWNREIWWQGIIKEMKNKGGCLEHYPFFDWQQVKSFQKWPNVFMSAFAKNSHCMVLNFYSL